MRLNKNQLLKIVTEYCANDDPLEMNEYTESCLLGILRETTVPCHECGQHIALLDACLVSGEGFYCADCYEDLGYTEQYGAFEPVPLDCLI